MTTKDNMYKVRKFDNEKNGFFTVSMTFEELVAEPWSVHMCDLSHALLSHLRKERSMSPMPEDPRDLCEICQGEKIA